jgi:hypothetical protein
LTTLLLWVALNKTLLQDTQMLAINTAASVGHHTPPHKNAANEKESFAAPDLRNFLQKTGAALAGM